MEFKSQTLNNGTFNDFNEITKTVAKINNFCQPINKSFKKLKTIVDNLITSGTTALGPGLLSSIEQAAKGAVGSKVIICTDG